MLFIENNRIRTGLNGQLFVNNTTQDALTPTKYVEKS
jgi:hypothetical protein